MKVKGGCFCGELRYEAEIDPENTGICHCRDCQKFSGSAFRSIAMVMPEHLAFSSGEPRYFEKTGDSGGVRRQAFCGTCGTHICALPVDRSAGGFVSLRLNTTDDAGDITPRAEIFTASRLSWLKPIDGAMQFAEMPPTD